MKYIIEIENLTKIYPNKFTALSELTFKVPKGVFGFLGPNGAGKTTLMEILVGLMKPTVGTASILGHNIMEESIESRRHIGYLPEKPGVYEDMSGFRFLRYMGELSGLAPSKASKNAKETLKFVGLNEWGEKLAGSYSAGMRQRLALAQALIADPEVIFLDEPTANLDPLGRDDVIKKVKELAARGKTIFISSHIIPEIEQMADHIAIIHEGKLVVEGSVRDLIRRQDLNEYKIEVSEPEIVKRELETRDFVSNIRLVQNRIFVKTADSEMLSSEIPKILAAHNMRLRSFEPIKTDLETIFRDALKNPHGGLKNE
ncbi:MAG: ABC transporter ATP-binding protein [Patescibacteria group bacterium]|nr:MAG: ABC transporter ATP-binding protein [Patescibacteria group bacterium]